MKRTAKDDEMSDKAAPLSAVRVEPVVGCQYFGCTEPATHKMVLANKVFCADHIAINMIRFGCDFEVEGLEPNSMKRTGN